jgi:hypothetical protein
MIGIVWRNDHSKDCCNILVIGGGWILGLVVGIVIPIAGAFLSR